MDTSSLLLQYYDYSKWNKWKSRTNTTAIYTKTAYIYQSAQMQTRLNHQNQHNIYRLSNDYHFKKLSSKPQLLQRNHATNTIINNVLQKQVGIQWNKLVTAKISWQHSPGFRQRFQMRILLFWEIPNILTTQTLIRWEPKISSIQ